MKVGSIILQKFLTIAKWPRLTFLGDTKVVKMAPAQRASGVNAVLSQLQGQSKVWQKMVDIPL